MRKPGKGAGGGRGAGIGVAPVPDRPTLPRLREAAAGCRACDLWRRGTQTVFGEGPADARVVMVGEQPGSDEDLAGRPFIGPAGRLLDKAMTSAGLDRGLVYVTNVVKHFKWAHPEAGMERSKRRLHQKPDSREIAACTPWLAAELAVIRPAIVVVLGATAAQALLGRDFRVTKQRGALIDPALLPRPAAFLVASGARALATIHPSAVLRAPDSASRRQQLELLVHDLAAVARELSSAPTKGVSVGFTDAEPPPPAG